MANENRYIPDKGRIKNCFAYRGHECSILIDLFCIKEDYNCPFYKSNDKQFETTKEKVGG